MKKANSCYWNENLGGTLDSFRTSMEVKLSRLAKMDRARRFLGSSSFLAAVSLLCVFVIFSKFQLVAFILLIGLL